MIVEHPILITVSGRSMGQTIHAVQNDTGRRFRIKFKDYDISSYSTGTLDWEGPNGATGYISGSINNGALVIDPSSLLVYEGPFKCTATVNGVSSVEFVLDIEKALDESGWTPPPEPEDHDVTVEPLSVNQNGTYTAPSGKAYSPVSVNVQGGGGHTLKEELFGYTPAGDVVYVPDENIPRYGIRGKRGITKLTIDFQNGYGFAQVSNNGYNIQYNDIPVYVFIGYDSGVTLPSYVMSGNGSNFILVCRGCKFGSGAVSQNALRGNGGLTLLDFTFTNGSGIQANTFYGDSKIADIIIRGDDVLPLSNINAFSNATPFRSGGSGGTLWVKESLISSYQAASNWSTILGYTNNQIKSIESTHNDQTAPFDMTLYYADGTPISA